MGNEGHMGNEGQRVWVRIPCGLYHKNKNTLTHAHLVINHLSISYQAEVMNFSYHFIDLHISFPAAIFLPISIAVS